MEKLNELVELVKEFNSATRAEEALAINNQFKATANRETILAIAEAFRAMEKRAEAAEARLAELAKQKPMGRVDRGSVSDSNEYPDARVVCLHEHVGWEAFQDGCELFTRPATAAELAELVPDDKAIRKEAGGYAPVYSLQEQQLFIDGATWLRTAILRKVDEAK